MGCKKYNLKEMIIELLNDNSKKFKHILSQQTYRIKNGELIWNGHKSNITVGEIINIESEDRYWIEVKPTFKERIKEGDFYYYVDIANRYGDIGVNSFDGNKEDLYFIETNNFFETSGEAEEKLNKLLEVLKSE